MIQRKADKRSYYDLPYTRRKQLEAYEEEAKALQEIRIVCPICERTVDIVFSDATGHKRIKCSRCKKDFVITLPRYRKRIVSKL